MIRCMGDTDEGTRTMKQATPGAITWARKSKVTRRAKLLAGTELAKPWSRLLAVIAIAAGIPMAVSGCTWQQAYSSAQGWQRNACLRVPDQTERERCLANASMTYDDYRSRGEETKKP